MGVRYGDTAETIAVNRCPDHRQRRKRHGVITSARLIEEQLADVPRVRRVFVTLTYADTRDWRPLDVTGYLNALRDWLDARDMGMAAVWVSERGKLTGRLHYHVVVWFWRKDGKRAKNIPMPDRSGQWRKGMTQVKVLHNPVGYVAKYVSKGNPEGAAYPYGMRLWGPRGLRGEGLAELRWWRAPRWVRELVPLEDGAKRLRHGWWGNRATRWAYRSPWTWDSTTGKPVWRGWGWDDVCLTGEAFAELSGSG